MKPDLINNLDKLINGTLTGKIIWTKPNDKVFIWQTTNSEHTKLNVILQLFRSSGAIENNIIFRLYEVDKQNFLIDLKTEDTGPEIKAKVFQLYQTIKDHFNTGRIDVLSDLLKDI